MSSVGDVHGLAAVLDHVAGRVPEGGPRVAIDGADGAGKTCFADRLAKVLRALHRPVVRISIDDFHHARATRHRQGRCSPRGFWADSYDYERFQACVLEPFAPGGSRRFRRASHDVRTDAVLLPEWETASPAAILVVEGIFLQRPELAEHWDLTVFLDVTFEEAARRMARRNGSHPDPEHRSMRRYTHAQRHYFAEHRPQARADILVDNDDYDWPRVVRDEASDR